MPFTGREDDIRRAGLAEYVVTNLCTPLNKSVTTDNWFTSTKLADDLLEKQITLLGTLRKNKPNISTVKNLQLERSEKWNRVYLDLETSKLLHYKALKNKAFLLLSTTLSDKEIDTKTGKPQMILECNAAKTAVDRVD